MPKTEKEVVHCEYCGRPASVWYLIDEGRAVCEACAND